MVKILIYVLIQTVYFVIYIKTLWFPPPPPPPQNLHLIFQQINSLSLNEDPTINSSKYFSVTELNKSVPVGNSIGALHLNISSLNHNSEQLQTLLSVIDYKFDIIAISETRIKSSNPPISPIHLDGYNEIISTPTDSSAGGVGLFISRNCNFSVQPRDDLLQVKSRELESIFIEVINPQSANIIVGCIYKHINIDKEPVRFEIYLFKKVRFIHLHRSSLQSLKMNLYKLSNKTWYQLKALAQRIGYL